MLKIMIQSMKYRRFKNILLLLQFTIGFAVVLFGFGCINHILQYEKNVKELASLDTVHPYIVDNIQHLKEQKNIVMEYRDAFLQVREKKLVKKMGFFELLYVYEDPQDSKTETHLYELDKDCISMSALSLEAGTIESWDEFDWNSDVIPVLVSYALKDKYKLGEKYPFSYETAKSLDSEELLAEVVGILTPSARFWRGGSSYMSENMGEYKEFILAPQFQEFTELPTYLMNCLVQLRGGETERELKLEEMKEIFRDKQMELSFTTLQEEVNAYYDTQKVVVISALAFGVILLVLSLLGCAGAILAGITTRYREFGIYYSMGLTKRNIMYLVQQEILVLFGAAFLLAILINKLFFEYALAKGAVTIDLPVIFASFLMMLVCVGLCGILPFLKLKNVEPVEMIKGENR